MRRLCALALLVALTTPTWAATTRAPPTRSVPCTAASPCATRAATPAGGGPLSIPDALMPTG
jgi:hypothetical protein